ncbi:cation:proton antiporter [Candidatus Bathyarchaeota archaeon]|nr:cation:proton antiporter [Candidatus Bathyarchaeota archaeon]
MVSQSFVQSFLLLISATLFLSYISNLFYTKTRIPDIVWLLGFGYLLGPVLGIFEIETFTSIFPLLILVTVSIFSFDTGIHIDISSVMRTAIKALLLSITTFLAVTFIVGFSLSFLFPDQFGRLEGLLLGAMIGGLGGISVSGILDQLKTLIPFIEDEGTVLNLESTLSDPIKVVACVTLIRMIMSPGLTLGDGFKDIVFTFTVSVLFGLAVGLLWAEVLNFLWGRPFNYMMTVAALFPIYIASEAIAGTGGGPITALAFGLTITNYRYISNKLGSNRKVRIDKKRIREFNMEITFLIKAFFFVYLGLTVELSLEYTLVALGIVALMLIVRYLVASGVGNLLRFTVGETVLSRVIFLQGTSALVLSELPGLLDPTGEFLNLEIYKNFAYPIVFVTIIFVSVVGPTLAKRQLRNM